MKDTKKQESKVTENQCSLPLGKQELKKKLTAMQYSVTCEAGTEPPFQNAYWNNERAGLYVDIVTGEPLFSSTDKFDSGTGWPSFTKPVKKENVVEEVDTSQGLTRTEVRAKKSDAHLGHVFTDGPAPTGQRYCLNSAALRFIPVEDLKKEGYGEYLYLFKQDDLEQDTKAHLKGRTEVATFGAGCFWGVEAAFEEVKGVVHTTVGYMGGTLRNPTYEDVCTNKTGHAEVVQVEYDPRIVSYEKLLDVFFAIHDPTTLNRQGPDVGTQYRSVIFFYMPKQEALAHAAVEKLRDSKKFNKPIVTEITAAGEFYKAEDYHQEYFKKRGITPTCHIPSQ